MTSRNVSVETAIEQALAEADIDIAPRGFVELVREALGAVRKPRVQVDPAGQLTDTEIAELRRGGLAPTSDRGAHDRVRARTAIAAAALMAGAISTGQAADRLGVDASRIRQLLAERRLLAARTGGEWRVLAVQFAGDGGLVPNISQVVGSLPEGLPPLVAASWLTTPEPDLEIAGGAVSPIEWLSAGGDVQRVSALAADL